MHIETILLRLIVSVILGGLIGAEREYRSKSAGFRTLMLICMGACLFTMVSLTIGEGSSTDRIASNIVTGIGFVGAGVIFKDKNHVNGITTAAGIWITAAVGMAIGAGHFFSGIIACGLTLLVLVLFHMVEDKLDHKHEVHHYNLSAAIGSPIFANIETMFKNKKLVAKQKHLQRQDDTITLHWVVQGDQKNHQSLVEELLTHKEIIEFNFYQ